MSIGIWIGFAVFLVFALSVDTFFLNQKYARPHESMRAALCWTIVWVACALIFNVLLWFYYYETVPALAHTKALEFLTGYLIEKSLSVDNLFVFYMIFTQFKIPVANQQRVFSYGIWGAIIMRLLFILIGTWLVTKFHWVFYIMGTFLILTGIKMCVTEEHEKDLAETLLIRCLKRVMRVTTEFSGSDFFIRKNKVLYATPLFIALILIEMSDIVFAFDSIPAIFAITTDPFIVWSANVFAILGLRAMYFILVKMINRFELLKYGVALILVFVGVKMLIEPWYKVAIGLSLLTIASILVVFGVLSFAKSKPASR